MQCQRWLARENFFEHFFLILSDLSLDVQKSFVLSWLLRLWYKTFLGIKEYPDDKPYPSRLILGWKEGKPLHVVAAETIIITVYQPDPTLWNADFRSKKS